MFGFKKNAASAKAVPVQAATAPRALTWAACKAGATRTANWAKGQLEDPSFVPNVLSLYKAPPAFDMAGYPTAAGASLRMVETHLGKDGDFHGGEPASTPTNGRTYRNAWLAWGAHRMGAYHLSHAALNRLEREMHPEMGAVPEQYNPEPARRLYDLGSNASALNAFLAGGRLAAAEKTGGFIAGLILHQAADLPRILLAADAEGRLFDPTAAGLTSGTGQLAFEVGAPGQVYWTLGFALRGLAQLYQASGHADWLAPANRIADWLARSHADHLTHITSAKLAWGAAQMFAATSQENWADLSLQITRQMVDSQNPDGIWLRPEFASAAEQPLAISLDTSLERLVYLSEIPRALALGGKPLP